MSNPSQTNVRSGSGRNQQEGANTQERVPRREAGKDKAGNPVQHVKPDGDEGKPAHPANGGYHPSNVKNR
jgi:hypothetical protein